MSEYLQFSSNFYLEKVSHCVAQEKVELEILLSQRLG